MKVIILLASVIFTLAAAEPPSRFRPSARQSVAPGTFQPPAPQSAPYNPRGWRPQGAALTLPKSQPQQAYGPPNPAPSYGPPPEEVTTEYVIESTEPPQTGKFSSSKQGSKAESAPAKQQQSPGSYYVVLPQRTVVVTQPQRENLVYVTEVQKSSPLVAAAPQATILAAPLTSTSARLEALPVSTLKTAYSPYYVVYTDYNLR